MIDDQTSSDLDRAHGVPVVQGASPLPKQLADVAEMLEDAWDDTVQARASRQMWDDIVHSLGDYRQATHMLSMWHRDSLLSSCRRLVDRTVGVSSVRRALIKLRNNASSLEEDLLPGIVDSLAVDSETAARLLNDVRQSLRDVVSEAGSNYSGHLTKAPVTASLQRLDETEGPILDMVNHVIAHRRTTPSDVATLDFETVDRFILEMQDILRRWIHLLRGIQPLGAKQAVFGVRAIADALKLFDEDAYADAKRDAIKNLGAEASSDDRSAAIDAIIVHYGATQPPD